MFKINAAPEFTHPVAVMVPQDDGHREETFKARFKVLPDDDVDGYDVSTKDGLKEFLRQVWLGASDIQDDDGQVVAWSIDLRDQLLGLPYVRLALLRTYMSALTKAKAGN